MTVALVASVAFLVVAMTLLILHRFRLGRAVRHRYGMPAEVLAAFFALLGVTGIVNTADRQWFPGRTALSVCAVGLLAVSVVVFGVLIAVAQRRRNALRREQENTDTPIDGLFP